MNIVRPLSTNERAESPGYTHIWTLDADELTNTTVTVAQSFTVALNIYDILGRVQDYIKTSFQNTGDTANNTTLRSLGDNSAVTTHTATAECNANGTVVVSKFSNTAVGPYTAANTLKLTFTPKSGTALNVINRGQIVVLFQIIRIKPLVDAVAASLVAKT